MKNGVGIADALVEQSTETETRHQELLELIVSQTFDTLSTVGIFPEFNSWSHMTTQIGRSSLNAR
jgi:hypothetical protein